MPLRDHFRSPLDDIASWEESHGGWPMEIVRSLQPKLPPEYVAAWEQPLTIGQPLPTLPLWLNDELAVALDLEESYEETCRVLRIR
jgi:hypothetical protein